jgi:hypothetical protein
MKRIVFLLVLFVLLFSSLLLFGQQQKDIYAKSVPILKILSHKLGYKIFFLTDTMEISSFYTPVSWFYGQANKGRIVWGREREYPYFTVIWEDGKFSYIKLFLQENLMHDSWGPLEASVAEVKDKFEIEEPNFKF